MVFINNVIAMPYYYSFTKVMTERLSEIVPSRSLFCSSAAVP